MRAPDPRTVVHRTIAPPPAFHTVPAPLQIPPPPRPAPRWALPLSAALFVAALGLFAASMHLRSQEVAGVVVVAKGVGR